MVLQDRSVATADTVALGGAWAQAYRSALSRLLARWEIWPLVGFALALVLVYLSSPPIFGLPFDDSYISLHFARNLADHGFLTFDGETASAGATSVLHVALLAIPIKLGADPVKASVAFGVVAHLGLVLAVYWLAWSIFRDRIVATLAGASVGVIGYLVFDALNGMETTLFLLVSALAAAALFSARTERGYLGAGLLAMLAVLTRPEGALLLGAMAAYYAVNPAREETLLSSTALRRLALLGAPSAIGLIALASFYWATTGEPTPGTANAKYLFFREFELETRVRGDMLQGGIANFIGPVLPWLALAAVAIRRREFLLFAFFWIAFMILYLMLFPGGITHYWYRYQHVFLPAVAVFGAAGLVSLVRGRRFGPREAAAGMAIGAALLGAVAFQYENFRDHYVVEVRLNETRQVAMAEFLNDVVPPGGTVATHDIGALGFFGDREVIDLVGLVNPDVIEYHDGRRVREYVDLVQPDYIVAFPSWEDRYLRLGLREEPELFERVRVFEGGREPFVIYRTHY